MNSERKLDALALGDGKLGSPGPGWFRPSRKAGDIVHPGDALGLLEVLGELSTVIVPKDCFGAIVLDGCALTFGKQTRIAVSHGELIGTLDENATGGTHAHAATKQAAADAGGLVFRAPTSGRFYSRSAPGKPAFVNAGDLISEGQTLCMLEVMKTFNRVTYGGAGLPSKAKVVEILVADEADVNAGDALLRIEAAS